MIDGVLRRQVRVPGYLYPGLLVMPIGYLPLPRLDDTSTLVEIPIGLYLAWWAMWRRPVATRAGARCKQ